MVPTALWIGWLDASDDLIAMSGTSYPAGSFGPGGSGVVNTAIVDGDVAGAGWAIASVALYDAPTGGDIVVAAPLPAVVTPDADEPLSFPIGSLAFAIAAG